MELTVINLESKMPTVDQAKIRLDQGLRNARSQKQRVLKLIHGYGSTGKGGAIKQEVALFLKNAKNKKLIEDYLHGEDFSPFNAHARVLLAKHPKLSSDSDYARENRGITLVFLL